MENTFHKAFVDVLVSHTRDGNKVPQALTFEDGKTYFIDRVVAVQRRAATKVGGTGIRYTIRIGNNDTYLFEDDDRWFVEAKNLHD